MNKSKYLGNVQLISHTPSPEALCGNIAKICYGKKFDKDEDGSKVLKKIIDEGHESVIEHAVFTFYLSNVSRVFTHELVRHRIASYTQKSTRYASNEAHIPVDYNVYGRDIDNTINALENVYKMGYNALINAGMPKDEARYFFLMG